MKTIRIFISSPGDVRQERKIAHKVITELNSQFAKYLHIEVLMWENFPLTADSTFQEGIDYFLKSDVIDFAVFILWSRMGTPLCRKFLRPDGTCYQSGTEYEFDMMMNLYKEKGWPRILTYVKQSEQAPTHLSNMAELEEYIQQKERLRSFITEHFRDEESNSNYAYLQFGENASFEHKFREHLKALIKPILGNVGDVKEWEGNPYVGLTSFEFEQNTIFCGRKQLVYNTASSMVDFQHPEVKKSLIVLGESGSGKSSFVKAGLLPFFCDNKTDDRNSYHIIVPSTYGDRMRQGIVDILSSHYTFLQGHPFLEEISSSNPKDKNFKYLTYSIDKNPGQTLLLYIDQFEEMFTDARINEEERLCIFSLLKGLVSTLRIHLVLSVRNDFYYVFARYEDLDWIKKHSLTVDMPVMGSAEILEIVEEPARKACLKWEVSDKGEGLNHRIVNEALAIRDLPLIEFALSELYNRRNEQDELTFEAYKEIGGLEGAIAQYADNFYQGLSDEEQKALEDILAYVVTKSAASNHTYVRKTALREDIVTDEFRDALIRKLIASHLFISGKDSMGRPTVTLAHEVLLRSWKAVSEWIVNEEDFLSRNTYYEETARYWIQNGKNHRNLTKESSKLYEAEYHHYKYRSRLSTDVLQFLEASFKTERRSGLAWRIIVYVVIALCVGTAFVMMLSDSYIDPSLKEWVNLDGLSDPVMLFSLLVYAALPLYSIFRRFQGKPIYQTIQPTCIIWSVLCVGLLVTDFSDQVDSSGWVMDIPIFLLWGDKLYTWKQRCNWKKRFSPRRFSDMFWFKVKSILLSCSVILFIAGMAGLYMSALEEKNEAMERRANTADVLFNGLDNIRDKLVVSDQFYIDTLWHNYLIINFKEELEDTICDSHERDFARCLINLRRPRKALMYLYPHKDWSHHLLFVNALSRLGRYEDAAEMIEWYLVQCQESGRRPYDELGKYNTAHFIWTAELAGRFDLAEEIYKQLSDTIVEMSIEPSFLINHGHVYLAKGDVVTACQYYDLSVQSVQKEQQVQIRKYLQKDMHTFSRFHVIDDVFLQQVCNQHGIEFIPAYTTHEEDSTLNATCYQRLDGTWRWEMDDKRTIIMTADADAKLMRYQVYEGSTLVGLINSSVRFEKKDGVVYWDEFCTEDDDNSIGRIISIDDDAFEIEVVENGNADQKGQRRRYTRVEDEGEQ